MIKMPILEVKFAKTKKKFTIKEDNFLKALTPNEIYVDCMNKDEVNRALDHPIGSRRLKEIIKKNEKIVIITSDITRPMPSKLVLPLVIERLFASGIKADNIEIILALGSHRPHTSKEKEYIVGKKIYNSQIKITDSDMNNCERLGMCNNGTPVDIFKPVVEADRVICLGNIDYHYFAGYSGGIKAIMPGVSSWEAIQANHSNMVKKEAYAGNLKTNPVRLDIDQVSEVIKVDFLVNVILDEKKNVVKAVAGDIIKAHREGCKLLDKLYGVIIEEKADIVITSPGGFPKDINLYQSQKALDNSKHAVKDGGIIILVASAKEGFGEEHFEEWMVNKSPDEMIKDIEENFILGGHKAAAIARILKNNQIFFVSDLEDTLVEKIGFKPFKSVNLAIEESINQLGTNAQIYLIPTGGSILPINKKK
jgi:nickel-dependent lactate racemase